jgi:aminobenzoyl-glutamate utilization protein B
MNPPSRGASCPLILSVCSLLVAAPAPTALGAAPAANEPHKTAVLRDVESMRKQTQVMIDMMFSFAELGFQEVDTSRYLTTLLEKEGFRVQRGVAGMPTAWVATWGSGRPVISLGSDIDCIPQASQKPGVAYRDPLVPGAPGHGEGHNSGQALNVTAALAVKRWLERERLPGTLQLWPGVAEEQLGAKAYLVRAGIFRDVDVAVFSHVDSDFRTTWGTAAGTGLVSVEYRFTGESAHAGGAPWRGRSALDGVELMNIGWNYRREHLRLQHRSHYVITDGGDQPNVVPSTAAVWYYFRELDYDHIVRLREIGDAIAQGAALMSNTSVAARVLGSAWPQHFNRPVAQALHDNIQRVGLPRWSDADVKLARALQGELKAPVTGLAVALKGLQGSVPDQERIGGSDDIGDVSWTVPTVVLRYPANIPGLPGHNWANAIAMATPIAHQGTTAGAKALALTLVDLFTRPELVQQSWEYFRGTQTKDRKYQPLIGKDDQPATWLNAKSMAEHRDALRRHHFDPTRFDTYLQQLGIEYPTVRTAGSGGAKK